ncbi:GNAT family N-acetyltransferase [Candidatus Bipolaricaulota bacterium]
MTSSNAERYRQRPVTADDIGAILAVVNTHSQTHYGDTRWGGGEVLSWFGPNGKPTQDDMEIWLNASGEACAYAQLCGSEWPPTWDAWLDVTVHPQSSGDAGLWAEALGWAEQKTQELIPARNPEVGHRCGARVLETDKFGLQAYERHSYERVRTETLMQIALDAEGMAEPKWPAGTKVRILNPERDLESYALAHDAAFHDHWGYTKLPREELIRKKQGELRSWGNEFIPELWFLATDGDEIVGGVGSFLNHGGNATRSYLYSVFVRKPWRNRGIATALLLHSFQAIHQRGALSAELHVDSENLTWALQLYRGVGMSPLWHQHLYEKVLLPVASRERSV